jgi:hypothetical protein
MSWVRTGECCQCGDCCIGYPFAGDDSDKENPRCSELMRTRQPEQPGRCPLLTFHIGAPQGDTSCLGHDGDPYYLSGCVVWPSHPDHIRDYPRCSYSFAWQEE